MWIVLYLTVIFTFFACIPKDMPDMFFMPKEAIYNLFGFSVIASGWMWGKNKRISYKNLWAGIFLIYTIAGFVWFFYKPLMFEFKLPYHLWNYRPTMNIILGLFLMQTLVENTDNWKRWIDLSKVICWMCGVFSLYGLLQYYGIDQIWGASQINYQNGKINPHQLMITFMSNKFLTACLIAMTAPLCLMFNDYKYKIIYGLAFVAIFATDCTTPLIAFIVTLFIYLAFTRKWKMLIGAGILSVIVLFLAFKIYPRGGWVSGRHRKKRRRGAQRSSSEEH